MMIYCMDMEDRTEQVPPDSPDPGCVALLRGALEAALSAGGPPGDLPPLPGLEDIRNLISSWADARAEILREEARSRSDDLSEAYNALQARNEEIHRELHMAGAIQARLIPGVADFPAREELGFSGFYRSMENIGGDLYDIIRIGRNSFGILIADVAGHGIPAALITALVKVAFRNRNQWGLSPREICEGVNSELHQVLEDLDHYVTVWYGIVDLETGAMEYCNCGHHPGILIRPGAGELVPLDGPGRFLGFFPEIRAETRRLQLQPGDQIFLYTDGIIETRNFFDEEYGLERMEACLQDFGMETVEGLVERVRKDMEDFCMGADQRDDQSMFAFQYNGLWDARAEGAEQDSGGTVTLPPRESGHHVSLRVLSARIRKALADHQPERALGMCDLLLEMVPGHEGIRRLRDRIQSLL